MYLHGVRGILGAASTELPEIPTLPSYFQTPGVPGFKRSIPPSLVSPLCLSFVSASYLECVNAKFAVSHATELEKDL